MESPYIEYQKEKRSKVVTSGYIEFKPKNIFYRKSMNSFPENQDSITINEDKFSKSEEFFQK